MPWFGSRGIDIVRNNDEADSEADVERGCVVAVLLVAVAVVVVRGSFWCCCGFNNSLSWDVVVDKISGCDCDVGIARSRSGCDWADENNMVLLLVVVEGSSKSTWELLLLGWLCG